MSSYGKRKGSAFETGVVRWLRSKDILAERLTKAGAKDEGDVVAKIKEGLLSSESALSIVLASFPTIDEAQARRIVKLRRSAERLQMQVMLLRESAQAEKR